VTDEDITTGYLQQDGARCHTSNASMRESESFSRDQVIAKDLWSTKFLDLTQPEFFLWGLPMGKIYMNKP
jgi:hypothetical protein